MYPHDKADKLAKKLSEFGFEPVVVGPIIVLAIFLAALSSDPSAITATLTALAALSPIWLPIFLLRYFWIMWMYYIRYLFWFNTDQVLLEVTLPPEVEKSPLAMEVVLGALHNSGGEPTMIARMWKGTFRAVWSLEIASNEGRVSYYMHMRRAARNIVEAKLYGQFPEAKITEVEDYVAQVPFNLNEYDLWGCEYDKAKAGAVPIKTYYDYALDKDTDKPEITVDPITNILEFFSTMRKDEYAWLQIICKARKKDEWYGFYKKADLFKEGGEKFIRDLIITAGKRLPAIMKGIGIKDAEDPAALKQAAARGAGLLSEDERNNLEAVEKSMGKLIFECGIRGIYLGKKGTYNPANVAGFILLFQPFKSGDLNSFNPARGLTPFNFPWQDYRNIRKNRIKEQLFFHYRNRAYFYVPYDQTPVFLNIEELASIWHFPNSSVQAPGLERVASKRAEAPTGLPI